MSTQANSTFQVTNWDEKPYHEDGDGPKLTRAAVTKVFRGELEGDATVEYLMVHCADGTATFVGIERVEGTLNGKSGSFVLEHLGTFEQGTAKAKCRVVTGSGTGDLMGLQGEGSFEARGREAPFDLEYVFTDGG
jgi:hypothetical protein